MRALRQQQQAPAPLVQVTDDAAQQPRALDAWVGARLVCTSYHGHILFTSITPAWLLSSQQKPTTVVRQDVSRGMNSARRNVVGRLADIPGHACIACTILASSRGPPRCHRNILIWIFAALLAVCSRVRPLACILSQIASRSRTRSRTTASWAERCCLRNNHRPCFVAR